jgi:hypothetical protein
MVAMVAQDRMISANVHDDRCRMDHGIAEWIEARLPRAKAADSFDPSARKWRRENLLSGMTADHLPPYLFGIAFAVANEFNDELGQHPHNRVIPVNELEVG